MGSPVSFAAMTWTRVKFAWNCLAESPAYRSTLFESSLKIEGSLPGYFSDSKSGFALDQDPCALRKFKSQEFVKSFSRDQPKVLFHFAQRANGKFEPGSRWLKYMKKSYFSGGDVCGPIHERRHGQTGI